MASHVRVSMSVNGQAREAEVEPRLLLVHSLRDELGLTGTHVGCDTSNCGACTCHLDGEAVKSCTVLAVQADGAEVDDDRGPRPASGALHPLQEAFWENHGLQCGYCTPGMIMAARRPARSATRTRPSDEIRDGARGQPLPLHGLPQHRQGGPGGGEASAPRRGPGGPADGPGTREHPGARGPGAGRMSIAEPPRAQNGFVGRPMKRKEDPRLITGRASYVGRHHAARAAATRRSSARPRPTRRSSRSTRPRRSSAPGIQAVLTGKDLELESGLPMAWVPPGIEVNAPEHWPLAKDTVKHVGDPSPSWSATTATPWSTPPRTCSSSTTRCPSSPTSRRRCRSGSPLVHEDLGTNKCHEWSLGGGDLEAGFAEADVVVERRVENHRIAGAPIEPRGVVADYKAGALTIWSSTQVPHFLQALPRADAGAERGADPGRSRPRSAAASARKLQIYGEDPLLALCSKATGRPVKWIETRSEHMQVSHHGRDQIADVRIGAQARRHDHRDPREDHRRPGRVPHAADADDPVARGVRDERLLPDPGGPDGHHRSLHEQGLHGRDPRRGTPRGDAHDRGRARPGSPTSWGWTGSSCGARTSSRRRSSRSRRRSGHLRLRRLPRRRSTSCSSTSTSRPSGASRRSCASPGPLPRHRVLHLHGDLRPRALAGHGPERLRPADRPVGVGDGPRAPHRAR